MGNVVNWEQTGWILIVCIVSNLVPGFQGVRVNDTLRALGLGPRVFGRSLWGSVRSVIRG